MILQVHTEKELIKMISDMKKTITNYQCQNKALTKRLDLMQSAIDKKPDTIVKETIIKEIETQSIKPTVDNSAIDKLNDRVYILECKKPIIKETVIKETVQSSKQGIVESDVLSLIYKHVTMHYINKLYKKGK